MGISIGDSEAKPSLFVHEYSHHLCDDKTATHGRETSADDNRSPPLVPDDSPDVPGVAIKHHYWF